MHVTEIVWRRDGSERGAPVQITEITVSYGQTQSLPDYCNVKPMVTLRAALADGEDPARAYEKLLLEARQVVEAEIDAALERHDVPARYDSGPRFRVVATRQQRDYREKDWTPLENVVAIIPATAEPESGDWFGVTYDPDRRGMRHGHALRVAEREAARHHAARVIDCADGDLSRLPQRPPVETRAEETPEELGL